MSFNEINISPVIPFWLIFIFLVIGFTGVTIQYLVIRKRLTQFRAISITILRLFVILFLITIALNPSIKNVEALKALPSLSILIDISPSMELSGSKAKRIDEAKEILIGGLNPLIKSLSEKFHIKVYAIGDSLISLKEEELKDLKPQKRRINLKEIDMPTSPVILLSDGNLNLGNIRNSHPIFTIPLGISNKYKDFLIKEIRSPTIAFRNREVLINVVIKSYGFKGITIPVLFKEGERLISAKNIQIDSDPSEITVSFSFTPDRVGIYQLNISIPPQSGEEISSNNQIGIPLKVFKDKIRILMVSGSPSISYRIMRMYLKNDPSIDLLSFVILRTPSDILNVPTNEQSLIPFPVDTLFSKELNNFDLLIFDNLPTHLYIGSKYYRNIRDFINRGGGFAMIGGPYLLDSGSYRETLLEEVLPISLKGKEVYSRDTPFKVRLTQTGLFHPITRILSDENENKKIWDSMEPLDGLNILEPKREAKILLETDDDRAIPVLIVSNYGNGRILLLPTDYSWKWYMGSIAYGKDHWLYLRMLERMIRWLTKDPSLESIEIVFSEGYGEVGRNFEFKIKMKNQEKSDGSIEGISLSIFNQSGIRISSDLKKRVGDTQYTGSFKPDKAGIYRLRLETNQGQIEEFVSIVDPMEREDGSPKQENLRLIAELTGGKMFYNPEDLLKELESYSMREKRNLFKEKKLTLFSFPFFILSLIGLLSIEWYLRRRWELK